MKRPNTAIKRLTSISVGIILSMLTYTVSAQQSSIELPDYHPVSPNAASLGNYGLYPVNKSLGNTSVSIPVYTLNEKGLTVPISLNYNMSGIRLNDLASWVGLGWSLNAGGAIIRNAKGLPDLDFDADIPDIRNFAFNQTNWDYLLGATGGFADTAPDEYVLNALGISGSFYFDRVSQQFVFDDVSQIKINAISKEEIHAVLQDGTIMIFGKDDNGNTVTEVTDSNISNLYPIDPSGHISAWYLTKLISKDREHAITFEYKTYVDVNGNSRVDDYSMPVSEVITVDGGPVLGDQAWRNYLTAGPHQLAKISKKYLDKIVFDNGYIQFESSLGREDLEEDYKLDAVKVYVNDGSTNGKLIDEYHFTYDYFRRLGGAFSRNYEIGPVFFDSQRQTRSRENSLKLTSMYRGPLPISDAKHSFEYNEENALPVRCTTAQDSWGYMNGNMGSLLPSTQASVTDIFDIHTISVGDGDRSPDEQKMKAGILERIIYPTGGFTEFELEANRLSVNETVYESHTPVPRAVAYGLDCDSSSGFNDSGDIVFDIPSDARNIRLHIYMSPVDAQGSGVNSSVSIDDKYFYRPTPNSSGGPSDSSDGLDLTIDLFFGYNLGTLLNPVPFQAGQHILRAHDIGIGGGIGATPCSRSIIYITWDEPTGVQSVEEIVGGLRVKSINSYDGISATPVQIKRYEYESPNLIQPERNRGYVRKAYRSNSGTLVSNVSTSPHFNNNLGGEPIIEYGKVTEYTESYLDDDNDATTPQNTGKVVSFYRNTPLNRLLSTITGSISFEHPQFNRNYTYQTDRWPNGDWALLARNLLFDAVDGLPELTYYESTSWKRGELIREETHKRVGNSYVLLNEVDNLYDNIASLKLYSNIVYRPIESDYSSWSVASPYNQDFDFNSLYMAYMIGEIEVGRRALKKSTVKQYDENGENPLTTITDYFYDNPNHLQLTRTESRNSEDEVIINTTYFPDDVASTTSLGLPELTAAEKTTIDRLKKNSLHRISEPVQTETVVNGKKTVQRTTFKDWYTFTAPEPDFYLVLPERIHTLKGEYNGTNNPLQERMVFEDYDTNGDVREVSKADGPSICYIWGYHKAYPIAKIENANYDQVSGYVANLQALSNQDYDRTVGNQGGEGALRTALNYLRTNLPDAMITTYTHDPQVGVTSVTDPRGYTMYYEYDAFNRLKEVKDADGHLITDYEYDYKQEVSN